MLTISLSLSLPISAFTAENILKETKDVEFETLCGSGGSSGGGGGGGILNLPHYQWTKIMEYETEEQRRYAAVQFWRAYYPYASWRRLISRLYTFDEREIADRLRDYTETTNGMLSLGSF